MSYDLYFHPLASFCHKVLIALYENDIAHTKRLVDFGNPESAAALTARWPAGTIPVLEDLERDRIVPETSIIIDYLQRVAPGSVRLIPDDPAAQLEVRLWDRVFDLQVSVPMQKIVTDRIRPEGQHDPHGVAEAHAALDMAYQMIERQVTARDWATDAGFSLADCAALPALFFAAIVHPFAPEQVALAAYFERLLARPSVQQVLDECRPFLALFPYREAVPARFMEAG